MTSRILRYLPLMFIIFIGVYFRASAIQNTDPTNVIEKPLLDDSFYYFTLGRNLADGKGGMVDDQHLTTGFQPLWGGMSIIPALLTKDPSTMVHLFQWMGVVVSALACVMIYFLTWGILSVFDLTPRPPLQTGEGAKNPLFIQHRWDLGTGLTNIIHIMALFNAALWYWHPHHVAYSVNGMETTLSTFATLAMLTAFVTVYRIPARRGVLLLGASMGLAFLARVDASMLILWLVVAIFLFPPIQGERIRTIIVAGFMSALVISPWALFTLTQGKFILPESGSAVRAHTLYTGQSNELPPPLSLSSALNGDPAFANYYGQKMSQFIGELTSQMYTFSIGIPNQDRIFLNDINIRVVNLEITHGTFFVIIGFLFVGGVGLFSQSRMVIGLWVMAGLWMITAITLYSFVVISWWFYERYTLPIAEVVSILVLCVVYAGLLRIKLTKWTISLVLLIVLGINSLIFFTYFDGFFDGEQGWISEISISNDNAPRSGFYEATQWLNENVPDDARIGAFQSGVIVYYTDATVINLDGKVNADAHHAMTDGRMWDYVCQQNLDYVVDWPVMIYFLLMQRSENWQEGNLEQIALIDGLINPIQINKVNRERCESD